MARLLQAEGARLKLNEQGILREAVRRFLREKIEERREERAASKAEATNKTTVIFD
jgi:hypothetical protein